MHKTSIFRTLGLAMLGLVVCLASVPLSAKSQTKQRSWGRSWVSDKKLREAFVPVIRDARESVVLLSVDGEKRVHGTIVEVDGKTGYVLSKASELVKGEKIVATLPDFRRVKAELVGVDRKNDLAMLKIYSTRVKFKAVKLVAEKQKVGRWLASVAADPTKDPVAVGIVSAQVRKIKPPQLMLGAALREDPRGLRVAQLLAGYGAAKAGVKVGDVLLRVDRRKIATVQQLIDQLQLMAVGDEVGVELMRDGRAMRLTVELSEYLPNPRSRAERMNRMGGEISERRRGFEQVLQHDGEIKPEHCGGPVVNLKGEVVGLNIARAGRIATYALPVSLIKGKLKALKSGELAPVTRKGEAKQQSEPVKADAPASGKQSR